MASWVSIDKRPTPEGRHRDRLSCDLTKRFRLLDPQKNIWLMLHVVKL